MKEITFINRNKSRWEKFELQLKSPSHIDPDELADQFIQLTDDLSYARTYYPRSRTFMYLNNLTQKTHQEIYRNKREKGSRFISFFTRELPFVLRDARPSFFLSLAIFIVFALLGAVSAITDDNFVRAILGDQYVNATLDSIEKGDPMAVYGNMSEMPMFLLITINNIKVSFMTFLSGLLSPLGTFYFLFENGVMVGSFQAFFYQKNLLGISTMAIMIHGTLELSAIVLAGGAGIIMGKNLIFPGTYPRLDAFIKGTKDGAKIMLGLIPVFIVAGFLEGFVTRYYNSMANWLNILIIFASLAFIVWYFFIYPEKVYRRTKLNRSHEHNQ